MDLESLRWAGRRHPRVLLALKTGVAAGLAWLLVYPLDGFVDDYPYYAPLGAVVAMSTAVAESVRSSLQAVAAIGMGAVIAIAVDTVDLPEAAEIAVGVGAGTALAGLRAFGPMAGWVPFATLFVLIVGGDQPARYVLSYGALTAAGAVVGIMVNLLLPQLPLTPLARAQDRLRDRLAEQLELLADGLAHDEVLTADEWADLRLELEPTAREVEDLVQAAAESRTANWQARRWAEAADRREQQARALRRLTGCVDEVMALVGDDRTAVHADGEHAARVRDRAATALESVAAMLRDVEPGQGRSDDEEATPGTARHAAHEIDRLADETARAVAADGDRYLAAGAIAVSLRQAVEAWT